MTFMLTFVDSDWSFINISHWDLLITIYSIHTVYYTLKNKKGSIWYLGKFTLICVNFLKSYDTGKFIKKGKKWIGTLMYNELFLKQETLINHQTKLSFHMFNVGDIFRSCKIWYSNNIIKFNFQFLWYVLYQEYFVTKPKKTQPITDGFIQNYWHLSTSTYLWTWTHIYYSS